MHVRGHIMELNPSQDQATLFAKACGCARQTYNHALIKTQENYKEDLKSKEANTGKDHSFFQSMNDLKVEFLKTKPEYFKEVPKDSYHNSFQNLKSAYIRFFKGIGKYPKLKKKGKAKDSFTVAKDRIKFDLENKTLKIQVISTQAGSIKLKELPRFNVANITSATVFRIADKWFVSCKFKVSEKYINNKYKDKKGEKKKEFAGIDLGIKTLAVIADKNTGQAVKEAQDNKYNITSVESPKSLTKAEKKKRRLCKELSRKVKGSNNRYKAKLKLARHHYKTTNIRKDNLHKLSAHVANNYEKVKIEDLNVSGMLKNHKLARCIANAGFHEFKRQLTYKMGKDNVILVDRFFPSSKLCNCCGFKNKELMLKDREWHCQSCEIRHDRDENAAINILNYETKIGKANPEYTPVESTNNYVLYGISDLVDEIKISSTCNKVDLKQELSSDKVNNENTHYYSLKR